MLSYDLTILATAFPQTQQRPQGKHASKAITAGDWTYRTAESLGLSADSNLRQLIEAPQRADQSADVMACAGLMARMGLSVPTMLGVLLNPENPISAHCLSHSDPERAARRAIEKAGSGSAQIQPGTDPDGIKAKPFAYQEPENLPERPWLYGRLMLRSNVTAVIAPGGLGKTTFMIGTALAMVLGQSILKHSVRNGPLCVWLWNLEDSGDELARSIIGAMKHWEMEPATIEGRLFVNSGLDGDQLCIATQNHQDGPRIVAPVVEALKAEIRGRGIDVLIVDPFVSSHMVSENDNMAIDLVVKQWSNIAAELNCAVVLVHHTRKANGQEVDAESARGASALVNAARAVLVLNRMTTKEAASFCIPEDERRFYFRVTADKQNRAPPAKADWYKLEGVMLGNGLHGGDSVGIVVPWNPPDAAEAMSPDQLYEVQRRVDEGAYRYDQRAKPWVGEVIADVLCIDISTPEAKRRVARIVDRNIASRDLVKQDRFDKSRKRNVPFVISGKPM